MHLKIASEARASVVKCILCSSFPRIALNQLRKMRQENKELEGRKKIMKLHCIIVETACNNVTGDWIITGHRDRVKVMVLSFRTVGAPRGPT